MAIGPVESRFYAELLAKLGLDPAQLPPQHDRQGWPRLREAFMQAFLQRPREQWCEIFADSDACVAPVLGFTEAAEHPHAQARGSFMQINGVVAAAPAPRFLGTPGSVPKPAPARGEGGLSALRDWGLTDERIDRLRQGGLGMSA